MDAKAASRSSYRPRSLLSLPFFVAKVIEWVSVFLCLSVHLKIEENSRMLRTGDLGIPDNPGDRYVHVFFVVWEGGLACFFFNCREIIFY